MNIPNENFLFDIYFNFYETLNEEFVLFGQKILFFFSFLLSVMV